MTVLKLNSKTFTADGTWKCPTSVTNIWISGYGGGGGGGGGNTTGAGGGGGGSIQNTVVVTVVPGTSYSITIGAGGTSGAVNTAGGIGGRSMFGALAQFFGACGGGQPSASGYGGSSWQRSTGAAIIYSNATSSSVRSPANGGNGGASTIAGLNGDRNLCGNGNYVGGTGGTSGAITGGGGGGGGAGPGGTAANGGAGKTGSTTGEAGFTASANTGAGGGGGGGSASGTAGIGGVGGSGMLIVAWIS